MRSFTQTHSDTLELQQVGVEITDVLETYASFRKLILQGS